MRAVNVVFIGLRKTERDLSPAAFTARAAKAMQAGGTVVEAAAKTIVQPHHFTGRFERGIHTVTTGIDMATLRTVVGVSKAAVPEAAPLTYGWESHSGSYPNIDNLARWVEAKMDTDDPVGVAIAIARNIFQSGFSFGKLDTFKKAFLDSAGAMKETMERVFAGGIF